MAGIPQRKPRDKQKFRDQYLANLQLENSNNQLNLNASKMYAATGASAQKSEPVSTTEKYAGMEGQKLLAKEVLVSFKLCNPFVAQDAVGMLTPEEVKFIDEYKQFIGTDFKGRNVPAQVIVNYIRKLRKKLSETEGVDYGIQQTGKSILSYSGVPFSPEDFRQIGGILKSKGFSPKTIDSILGEMVFINELAFKPQEWERAKLESPEILDQIQELNDTFMANIPNISGLITDAERANIISLNNSLRIPPESVDAIRNARDLLSSPSSLHAVDGEDGIGQTLADEQEDKREKEGLAISDFEGLDVVDQNTRLQELGGQISASKQENVREFVRIMQEDPSKLFPNAPDRSIEHPPAAFVPGGNPEPGPEDLLSAGASAGTFGTELGLPGVAGFSATPNMSIRQLNELADKILNLSTEIYGKKESNELPELAKDLNLYIDQILIRGIEPGDLYAILIDLKSKDDDANNLALEALIQRDLKIGGEESTVGYGLGKCRGKGIGRKMSKSVVPKSSGYVKLKPYRQFGKYLINTHKLQDGILMLRLPSGNALPHLPTQKITEDLQRVLKIMTDGKIPQYTDFHGLGVEDKEKFHHIVRHSKFEHLEVPPPNKEIHDKELDRFEILRGELQAGNDNKEIAREFKSMLLRFMRQGRIPKREAHEIMEHMLLMGQ